MRAGTAAVLVVGSLIGCGGGRDTAETTGNRDVRGDSAYRADSVRRALHFPPASAQRHLATSGGYTCVISDDLPGPAPFSGVDPEPALSTQPLAGTGVRTLTTYEAADQLRGGNEQVTVAILYGTRCPRSRAMFLGIVSLAGRYEGQLVKVAAFAVDQHPEDVADFLARYRAPFDPLSVRRWERGQVSGALSPLGFDIGVGATFNMPYVAVLGRDGHVRAQWDAATNLAAIDQAVRAELSRR